MGSNDRTMFEERAELYDRIYHWKDYSKESERVVSLLRKQGIQEDATLLEAACGTGNYLEHLQIDYRVSGFDISPGMVEASRTKLPGIDIFQADMTDFSLDVPVDAIVCLFSSIGYVFPDAQLRKAADCFYRNIKPGGCVLVEPWLEPHIGLPGHFNQQTYDGDDMKLCRSSVHKVDGRISVFDFHWLVTTAEDCEHFVENHQLWMYTRDELVDTFKAAGFETEWLTDGLMRDRGMVVARRPV